VRKFVLTTSSESNDDYMYFIKHPTFPTNDEINNFLLTKGNDKLLQEDEEISMEGVVFLEEIKDFQTL